MKVNLIASTRLEGGLSKDVICELGLPFNGLETDAERLIEFAGRLCYKSFHRPRPETAKTEDYIKNIIAQGHESVLEHASASFHVSGVSRNMLLELERHRHLSFSVISQRFVDSSTAALVYPPALEAHKHDKVEIEPGEFAEVDELLSTSQEAMSSAYEVLVKFLQDKGFGRKQSREAARAVLPGGIETEFVVTGNLRAWRDVLKKRYSKHADAEICEFAGEVLQRLRDIAEPVFADFPDQPFD